MQLQFHSFNNMQHAELTSEWQRIHNATALVRHPVRRDKFTELILAAKAKSVENTHRPLHLVTRRASKQASQCKGRLEIKSWPKVKFNVPLERVFTNERYTSRLSQLPRI